MDQNPALLNLLQSLSQHVVYAESSNVETNRKLWNRYAEDWKPDAEFVTKMVHNLPGGPEQNVLAFLGDEWSDKQSLEGVITDFFKPNLKETDVVAEIGSGGGRVSTKIAPLVSKLTCFDISAGMLKVAKSAVEAQGLADKVDFVLLETCDLPVQDQTLDFIYAFDVFPHCDLHTIWKYVQQFSRCLKPGGHAIIHTANLATDAGWTRFAAQKNFKEGGFYFITPDILHILIQREGNMTILRTTSPKDTKNMYYLRDYMILVQKKAQ